MLEFVFKKSELRKLIDDSGESDENVIVRLKFDGKLGAFTAHVNAFLEGKGNDMERQQISGCPRPPGCG